MVGYSLNTADEHFNDLLRALNGKRITVIGPDVLGDSYMARVASVWGVSAEQFTRTQLQSKPTARLREITLIQSYAHEIDLGALQP